MTRCISGSSDAQSNPEMREAHLPVREAGSFCGRHIDSRFSPAFPDRTGIVPQDRTSAIAKFQAPSRPPDRGSGPSSLFTQRSVIFGDDGDVLRPLDDPVTANVLPDWQQNLFQALARRPELRRQKWSIKSLQLQLRAAENLTRPRLDFVSAYQVNGFGDNLLGSPADLLIARINNAWTAAAYTDAARHATARNKVLPSLFLQESTEPLAQ